MTAVHTPATMGSMPNQPVTPVTAFRIPPDLKARAVAKAAAEGVTLTSVIIRALERYVKSK